MNIVEILESIGAEKGYPLYSPITGECTLGSMNVMGIVVYSKAGQCTFYPNGTCSHRDDAECLLFPSKDNRDWSTVKGKKQEKPKKQEHQFKPFERVLARDNDAEVWQAAFFSHYRAGSFYSYKTTNRGFNQCIPYEGNEHLLGTRDKPEEE